MTLEAATTYRADDTPVSERIRARLMRSGTRFHANDNIADHIEPGELDALLDEVSLRMQGVLESLVIDTANDHNSQGTARRVAKMYLREVFGGRYTPAPPVTEFPNVSHLNELMIIGPIAVRSACSHHLCQILGKVWIGIMPNEHSNLIGLSKYVRLTDWVMNRPQIQEEAVKQLAELLRQHCFPLQIHRALKTCQVSSSPLADTHNFCGVASIVESHHFARSRARKTDKVAIFAPHQILSMHVDIYFFGSCERFDCSQPHFAQPPCSSPNIIDPKTIIFWYHHV